MFFKISILFISLGLIHAAVPHTHKHTHSHGNKERTEDGGYSPRDSQHMAGGEHHSEFDHEAILGSVKEAEEFDNLTPEESKQRLAILITKMDTNNDKFIDRHELKAWILRSFKSLSEEEATDRFEEIDEDEDNKITWMEYMKNTYGMDSDEDIDNRHTFDSEHIAEENKLIADDKQMFKTADFNNDSYLSSEEFVKFLSPEEHPDMLPLILDQTLRDKDLNNDKKIDFQEFIGDSAKHQDKEWLLAEKDKFDEELDLDNDGYLNGNEILSWVVPSNE